jgi:hypothetical protein
MDREQTPTKRYAVQYPISEYTFPTDARIRKAHIDADYIHIELMDERVISIPLRWIPTVYHAKPEERNKFEISRDRTMLIWDPEKCAINDELRLADYLGAMAG